MKRKIKIFICGVGNLGKYIKEYAENKGFITVGLYDKKINKIISENEELKKYIAVENLEELKKALERTKPDVCIVTTSYLLKLDKEVYDLCVSLGINVLTTCEEAFFPFSSDYKYAKELDENAKRKNCTIMGTGFQDIYWGQLVSTLASSLNKIILIKGKSYYDIDNCNKEINLNHGVGLTIKEYKSKISINDDNELFIPSFMWNVNGWLASKLNLRILKSTQKRKPVITKVPIYSNGLKRIINVGQVIGTNTIVESETKEGIKISSSTVGKIFSKNTKAKTKWCLYGDPHVNISLTSLNASKLTASITVNRIPDVINARAGFVTTDKIGELIYRN